MTPWNASPRPRVGGGSRQTGAKLLKRIGRLSWANVTAINLVGAALWIAGSDRSLIVYWGGILLLLPGSAISFVMQHVSYWLGFTDSWGDWDFLYLPVAVAADVLLYRLPRR